MTWEDDVATDLLKEAECEYHKTAIGAAQQIAADIEQYVCWKCPNYNRKLEMCVVATAYGRDCYMSAMYTDILDIVPQIICETVDEIISNRL